MSYCCIYTVQYLKIVENYTIFNFHRDTIFLCLNTSLRIMYTNHLKVNLSHIRKVLCFSCILQYIPMYIHCTMSNASCTFPSKSKKLTYKENYIYFKKLVVNQTKKLMPLLNWCNIGTF